MGKGEQVAWLAQIRFQALPMQLWRTGVAALTVPEGQNESEAPLPTEGLPWTSHWWGPNLRPIP